jgi:NAD(P)-dependent dehydrogenase (short-subunit alcohol dehydrogenase family)
MNLVMGLIKSRNAKFIHCDVTSWENQLCMFKWAKENSPNKSVDVVVACAGITGADPVYNVEGMICCRHPLTCLH